MWAIVVSIGTWVYRAFKVAAQVSMAWIRWAVAFLYNWSIQIGRAFMWLGRRVWTVLRATWDHVLKPAWQKFDRFVTRVHDWLEKHFAPLLKKLNEWRKTVNGWWKKYISPILTLLDVARSFLQILARLGVDWAKKLDAEIARLESLIMRPFLEFNRRLNEVGDWINRIVTLDGLFQRLALLKSLARDAKFAANIWWHTVHRTSTDEEHASATEKVKRQSAEAHAAEVKEALRTASGPIAGRIAEETADFRAILKAAQ